MQLTLHIHPITAICFGCSTQLEGTSLQIDAVELRRHLLTEKSLVAVDLEIVSPGESCRAGPVFDIIEPRAKAPGGSPDFPGILGAPRTAGIGTTHVLQGAAVTVLREKSSGDSRGATGYVLEMSGAPAAVSKYGSLNHLVVIPHTRPELPDHAQQKTYRLAGLRSAVYLARAAFGHAPASSEAFAAIDLPSDGLPRVAYVGQIFSRQRKPELDEQILYGLTTDGMLPVVLDPDEWLDGAVVPSYHTSIGGA